MVDDVVDVVVVGRVVVVVVALGRVVVVAPGRVVDVVDGPPASGAVVEVVDDELVVVGTGSSPATAKLARGPKGRGPDPKSHTAAAR